MERIDSLSDLLDLQAVDLEIDRLLHRRQSLTELDAYRQADQEGRRLDAQVEELEGLLREERLQTDKAEGELRLLEEKAEIEERRLYAGGLSARETEHLRQEVESLKRRISELEDQALAHLDRRDDLESRLEGLQEERAKVKRRKEELHETISAEWRKIDAELARKEDRKRDFLSLVSDDILALYDELRETKEGVAVGRLAEGVCGGCHLKLSAAEQVELMRADPPRCLHCRRILVPQ